MTTGALSGIRVLDLSRVLAGPSCGQLFADLGAEVIKVEDRGDENRTWPPVVDGHGANLASVNRGKRGMTLNLKSSSGQRIFEAPLKRTDVLIEKFPPETAKRLGLAWERTSSVNPDLIHVSIAGYGSRGPLCDRPGYDNMVQAFSGMMAMTGEHDRGPSGRRLSIWHGRARLRRRLRGADGARAGQGARAARGSLADADRASAARLPLHHLRHGGCGAAAHRLGRVAHRALPVLPDRRRLDPRGRHQRRRLAAHGDGAGRDGACRRPGLRHRARWLELAVKLEPHFLERGTQEWAALFDETKVACSLVQDITEPESGPEGDAAHAFYAAAHRARPRAT